MSAARENERGLPLSNVSSRASSSECCSIRSANLLNTRPRARPDILGQGPSSKARRAAATARSISRTPASATLQIVSPVRGSMLGKVLPSIASSHRPSMSSRVAVGVGAAATDEVDARRLNTDGMSARRFATRAIIRTDRGRDKDGTSTRRFATRALSGRTASVTNHKPFAPRWQPAAVGGACGLRL